MRFLNPGEGTMGMDPGRPPENLDSKLFWTESRKIGTEFNSHTITGRTQQVIVAVLLVFPRETTKTDVIQILEPLKVGDGHTTSIAEQVLQQVMIINKSRERDSGREGGKERERREGERGGRPIDSQV